MKCKDCKWWFYHACQHNPPRIIVSAGTRDGCGCIHGDFIRTKWPQTKHADFCGEFEEKKQ